MNWEFIRNKIVSFKDCLASLTIADIKTRIKKLSVPKKIFYSLIIIESFVLICAVIVPKHGKILPIDKSVIEAYSLLKKSPTGRKLINRVKKTTSGNFTYIMMGKTDRDELFDYSGDVVRALTRSEFRYYGNKCSPKNMTIIANRDIIGINPEEVVKSLAFELENVLYAYQNPYNTFGKDSPLAKITRERVIRELGL